MNILSYVDLAKETIGTYVSFIVVCAILGILIKWLFIKSAIKAGTKEAIEEVLKEKYSEQNNIQNNIENTSQ